MCVEKMLFFLLILELREKHLHVRGEDWNGNRFDFPYLETPPRAWRRYGDCKDANELLRNTSTCVEKMPAVRP